MHHRKIKEDIDKIRKSIKSKYDIKPSVFERIDRKVEVAGMDAFLEYTEACDNIDMIAAGKVLDNLDPDLRMEVIEVYESFKRVNKLLNSSYDI